MEKFQTIFDRASARHGGEDTLRAKLAEHHHAGNISGAGYTDDRWLAEFTKRVFQSGFSWKVVETKWAGFETAFWDFNVTRCVRIDMDDMERLTSDKGIIRNAGKIKSVPINAQMIINMRDRAGSADPIWGKLDLYQTDFGHVY